MTIESKTYKLTPGSKILFSADFINATVLMLARESDVYYKTTSTPFDGEFKHTSYDGKIEFMNAGASPYDPSSSTDLTERIYVKYKY